MNWSFMIDPFNLLNMRVVPCTLAIDEHGIIQAVQPRLDRADEFIELFVNREFAPPDRELIARKIITQADKPPTGDATALSNYAVALTLWESENRLDEAIDVSKQALSLRENDRTHFNSGVMYRMRHDSEYRQPGDFTHAVKHWTVALNHDPNNYIWRRRIQQYGPRLDKPYPFYDWIPQARKDILERDETPLPLSIEPGGAEFAGPLREFNITSVSDNPDPDNRIYQDAEGLIDVDIVLVPPQIVAGESARVHITMRPSNTAHWNNEVDETVLWVDKGEAWQLSQQYLSVPNAPDDTSNETRHFEFEVQSPQDAKIGQNTLAVYSLYYVCEDVNGICLYRRKDLTVPIEILPGNGRKLKDGG